jgi:hypothetical protein
MGCYLIDIYQEITNPLIVEANNIEGAQKRAVYGQGEFGDQEASELRIVSTRFLEPTGEA